MTVTEKINTMDKQEFQDLFFYILQVATTKYNISFFPNGFVTDKDIIRKYNSEKENEITISYDFNKSLDGFENIKKEKPVFGIFKNRLKTPDDFNKPLEDFKDYM